MPEVGIVIVLLLVALHLLMEQKRLNTLVMLVVVTLIGGAWDSILTGYDVLIFNSGMMLDFLAPSWIMAMWLMFATTLNVSFRWLHGRYWLAMLMGAICGPLTYQAGAALGAVEIPNDVIATIYLAVGWSALLPLLIKLSELCYQSSPIQGES